MSPGSIHPPRGIADLAPRAFVCPDGLMDAVERAYASPGRHYHTLTHIAHMALEHAEVDHGPGWRDPSATWVALLAHDAVYDAARTDNEALSAALARQWCATFGLPVDADRVDALVRATASHHAGVAPEQDPDLALFLDCDLAILGAEPPVYDLYERGVALEYAAVYPEAAYRLGRSRFLADVLERPSPFNTAFFTERLAERARTNITRALAALNA